VQKADGEVIHLRHARDALVLKALSALLAEVLPISPACTYVKGHGGLKSTVRRVHEELPNYRFVLRTDVKEYYASIDHFLLTEQLAKYIKDKFILNLLWQYLHRMVECGGSYREIKQGISRGCPLSPLIGAFFLSELDQWFQKDGLFYVRYINDILILIPTRWKLRRAVQVLNQSLAEAKLEKHPDKTFIGRIEKDFDFLGYHFNPEELSVTVVPWEKFAARWHRLYEQKRSHSERRGFLGDYVRRWQRWTTA
jgi:RNA-directed DNA polymerase